jgi:hypothetical protein
MNRLKLLAKVRQDKILESKVYGDQNYKDDKPFCYKLFDTIIYPSILRLHWKHLLSSC